MSIVVIIMAIVCVLSMALFLFVRPTVGGVPGLLTKIIASVAFLLTGLLAISFSNDVTFSILVCCGLLCGLLGDILLDLKVIYPQDASMYLNSGMLSFGVGHLFYLSSLVFLAAINGIGLLLPLLIPAAIATVFTLAVVFGAKFLNIQFGKFLVQSALYSFILSYVCGVAIFLAILMGHMMLVLFAIGLGLILLSDLILSLQYFGGQEKNKTLIVVNHLLYYIGQIMIAIMLFFI